jgi:hypothetical protein
MPGYNDMDATRAAAELVKAVLASGELKLLGPYSAEAETAKKRAVTDAVYLSTLINDLAAGIKAK